MVDVSKMEVDDSNIGGGYNTTILMEHYKRKWTQ